MSEPIITSARYAKGMMLAKCPSQNGWKSRAARLAEYLRGRYTNRERGYILSPRKAQRLAELYAAGYDATYINATLIPPSMD